MTNFDETELAAIDVGSNAVHLKLVHHDRSGRLVPVLKRRALIRPGEGAFQTGRIAKPALGRLVDTLADWGALCRARGAQVRSIATSAIRDATNQDHVVSRVRSHAGLHLEVISGEEEARLMCLGALAGMPADVHSLCIDIGGGSTEVALAQGEDPIGRWSLGIGALRLSEEFGEEVGSQRVRLAAMRARAAHAVLVLPHLPSLPRGPRRGALACSGTARALVNFAAGDDASDATAGALSHLVEDLAALGRRQCERRFGPQRAELILPAAVILEALCRRLRLDWVRPTRRGLRDGVLIDLSRHLPRPPAAIRAPA
ncbi:MAG TPA: exopolyphosphatase [Polyangia bacterium]|jgi:exopolyphosphatase/guanosine-5'-triphosphate,3'-diphosphate pyrophosphatase|nr:exopolyphosphatase [Polyangia bacterium]